MGSRSRTRKLADVNENLHIQLPESSTQPRTTRPRLEIDPLGFGIQLPPPSPAAVLPPEVNTDDEDTQLTMYFYVHQSEQQQQPQPQQLPLLPPTAVMDDRDQDSINRETELTMYFYLQESQSQSQPLPQTQPQPQVVVAHDQGRRTRKKPTHAPREGKSPTIQPPFPWATDRRAQVHTLEYLTDNGIKTISGDVQCKRCQKQYQIQYNLEQKFKEVSEYVANNDFKDRAPDQWMTPILPTCDFCHQENSAKPVMNKKKSINWLFLLLGQMLGCCKLAHLKYFCKHTGNHRTGAKNRVLFLTYLGLCKQVNPDGPYHYDLDKQQQLYPILS